MVVMVEVEVEVVVVEVMSKGWLAKGRLRKKQTPRPLDPMFLNISATSGPNLATRRARIAK